MNAIEAENLTKRFGAATALDRVSLAFPAGSFTALLGPSGCGKTTLLRLIAGFEAPDGGRLLLDGALAADARRQTAPEERGIGFVFQSYALWPHLDVAGNVAYPLRARRVARADIAPRVAGALETVGLSGFGTRRIDELSGGQRQRVALARCLVAQARIILFDEPLANLDIHLRAALIDAFRRIHRQTEATVVYVTHDQGEALALASRIAVMEGGRVAQVAAPADLYRSPAALSIARFVGRGAVLNCVVGERGTGSAVVTVGGARLSARAQSGQAAGPAKLLLRPENLSLGADGLEATVVDTVYRGPVYEARLALAGGGELVADSASPLAPGQPVRVAVRDAWIIPSPGPERGAD
jgi:iron(III) transport system ATP-binding protein